MRVAGYIGAVLGLALLLWMVLQADLPAMLHALQAAGLNLLWLVPYRGIYFLLYATGWFYLLKPYDPERRAGLAYLWWVTSVREGIDRLLPVASVGGGVAGVRLLRWRGLAGVPVSATVIVEIVLTLAVSYAFAALGLILLVDWHSLDRRLLLAFLVSLPVPVVTVLLLRHGSVFARLQRFLRPLVGTGVLADEARSLDREVRACLARSRILLLAAVLQLASLVSGAFEVWLVLRLCGHPVDVGAALILESMTQIMRHVAFVVPAGLGVQEATLILFGHALGVTSELALAVSMAKRVREVVCGLPALISWQWMEARRL